MIFWKNLFYKEKASVKKVSKRLMPFRIRENADGIEPPKYHCVHCFCCTVYIAQQKKDFHVMVFMENLEQKQGGMPVPD